MAMTPELTALTLAALVQVVTFVAYAIPANRELGRGYTMSARDRDPTKTMTDGTARLGRAMNNMFRSEYALHSDPVLAVSVRACSLRPGLLLCVAAGPFNDLGSGHGGHGPVASRGPLLTFQMDQNPGGVRLRTGAAPPRPDFLSCRFAL